MKNDEVHKLMRELQDANVRLPLRQANLRKQLMAIHAVQRNVRPATRSIKSLLFRGRSAAASRHIMRLGLIIGATLIILLSLLTFLPTANNSSNRKFVTAALPAALPEKPPAEAPDVPDQKSPATTKENNAKNTDVTQSTPKPSVKPASSPAPSVASASSAPPASAASESEPIVDNNNTEQMATPDNPRAHGGPKKEKAPKDKPHKDKAKD